MGGNLVRFRSLIIAAVLSVAALAAHARAQGDDPIAARLEKAREAYEASEEAFRKAVLDRLPAAEERATKAGNKAGVDQAVADREDFEARGTTPKSLKLVDLQAQRKQARARLLDAYSRAVI